MHGVEGKERLGRQVLAEDQQRMFVHVGDGIGRAKPEGHPDPLFLRVHCGWGGAEFLRLFDGQWFAWVGFEVFLTEPHPRPIEVKSFAFVAVDCGSDFQRLLAPLDVAFVILGVEDFSEPSSK